jgi:hypothetical protein
VRTARIEQRGDFRLGDADAPWLPFAATEHVAVKPPGFVWDATIDVAPFVPGPGLDWEPIDEGSARATLSHRGTTVSCVFHVDGADEVTRVTAERPRSTDDGYEPTPWTGSWRRYRERSGLLVPTEGEVAWNLPDGDLPYWRGRLTSIEHRTAGDRPLAPA